MLETFAAPTPPANGVTGQLWYDTTNKVLRIYDSTVDPQNAWAGSAGGGISAGNASPSNPKAGTLWFDSANAMLKIFDGTSWIQIFPMPASLASKAAFVTEYNSMATTINKIIGAPSGTALADAYGYGQTDILSIESVYTMTNAKWITLLNKLTAVCNFLGVDASGISTEGFIYEQGNTIPYGMVTMLAKYNSTLAALTALTTGTTRFKPALVSLESTNPASASTSRSTTWTGTISRELTTTFADAASLKAYINAGGQFQFVSTLANAGTLRDYQWRDFLANIGTVKFSATGSIDSQNRTNARGFYDLTTTYQPIFAIANPNNSQQVFTINARIESNRIIRFQVVFTDPGTLYGGVGGTLTSAATLVRPSANALKTPVMAYPTTATTALA